MTTLLPVAPRCVSAASLAIMLLVGTAGAATAQGLINETKLIPISPPLLYSGAGTSAAISGTTAVVGAPYGGPNAQRGSAHVFVKNGAAWTFQATLFSNDPDNADQFGTRVAIQGDTILISAPYTELVPHGIGAVYVFERVGTLWNQTAKLQVTTDFGDASFGIGLALDGDTAVVSDYGFQDPGRLVVIHRVGGVWDVAGQTYITSVNPQADSTFGGSLAIQGNIIVAGAPGDSVLGAQGQGTVQIFKESQGVWSAFGALITSDSGAGDSFGASVALDGDLIVVGAPFKNNNRGAVYVFHKNGGAWTSMDGFWAKLLPKNPQDGETFGFSVTKSGGIVLVGAPGRDSSRGATYGFNDLTGTSNGTLNEATGGVAGDQYGWSTALDGLRAVIGATIENQIGVAYAYDVAKPVSFPRINWNLALWPYKYIYMGCPIDLVENGAATITIERGEVPLSFAISLRARHGTVRFTSATTIEYRPDRGFSGRDVFTVRVTDRAGVTLEKRARVRVVPAVR